MAFFGPAGRSQMLVKYDLLELPIHLKNMGLNAFEYQCGRGVRISSELASKFGKAAARDGIAISLHAPYYISFASRDDEKRLNSLKYILSSAKIVKAMGSTRIVIHPGSIGDYSRKEALCIAKDTLKLAICALDEYGYSDVRMCLETMGKVRQLGTLDEILELCKLDERLIPCIDWGHLNSRECGAFKEYSDYEKVLERIEQELGTERLKEYHSHFSKIEYSKGGERRHLTFSDSVFGPDFEPVLELSRKKGCEPTFICESDGTQAEDAIVMKNYWENI